MKAEHRHFVRPQQKGCAPEVAGTRRPGLGLALLSTAAAAALMAPSLARAQAAPTSAASGPSAAASASLSELVVTAAKREQNIYDVPQSITALTGEQLKAKGVASVQDLVKVTPGLSYVDSGKNTPVYSLRGVGFFDGSIGARPTVSVYLDEAPIPFSIESKGASFDLDRVEVLKGPQGTLFGQNSTGGAINFIAAKPTDVFAAGGSVSYGRFNTADVQGYVSGPLSSTLEARLAVRTLQSGDWQKSYTRNDTNGAQDFTQARLILDWRPVDRLKVSFDANGFHDGSDVQAAQFKAFLPGVPSRASLVPLLAAYPVSPSKARAADWNAGQDFGTDNTFYQTVLRADYDVSAALALTSLTTYSHEKVQQNIDADGVNLTNLSIFNRGSVSTVSQELRAAGQVGPLHYIVGASYEGDRTRENGVQDLSYSTLAFAIAPPPFPPLDMLGVKVNQNFKTTAVFGNVDYDVLDRFVLHGGVRYTQADLSYQACTPADSANAATAIGILTNTIRKGAGLPPIAAPVAGQCASLDANLTPALGVGSLNQGNVSWRAGLDFKPEPGILLYVNASKGFKAGSVTGAPNNINAQFQPVVAESVLAYEAGFKARLLDRKLDLTGAVFYYDYQNKQLQGKKVFTPNIFGPINVLINVPKSRVEGAEIQASIYPVEGLTLTAGATYLDTEVTKDFFNYSFVGSPANFNGNPFPYTPRYQVVLGADYRYPLSDGKSAFAGVDANIRSRTTAGFGNEPVAAMPGYTLVDLRLGIERNDGRWRAELFGRNVTNAYYYTNVVRVIDTVRAYAGMPVTYGVRLSYRY